MKKFLTVLTITTLAITLFAGILSSVSAPPIENYEVDLLSVDYNPGTNLQNWTYRITCNEGHGVSHVVFEFKTVCDPPLAVIDDAGPVTIHISTDYNDGIPPTGIVGIKFENFPTGDGSIEPGESADVWFTLVGEWPVGTIEVHIKAANDPPVSQIVEGPECRIDNRIPEIPLGTVMAGTSMILALAAYLVIRKRNKN